MQLLDSKPYSGFPISLNIKARFLARLFKALHSLAPLYLSSLFSRSSPPHSLPSCHPGIFAVAPLCRCAIMQSLCSGYSLSWMLFSQIPTWWFFIPFSNICSNLTFSMRTSLTSFSIAIFPHISWALWILLSLVYFSLSCFIYHLLFIPLFYRDLRTYYIYLLYVHLLCLLFICPLTKKEVS